MGEYITMTLSDDEGEEDYYNKEISMDELEGAVSRLKIDSAPGPDINTASVNFSSLKPSTIDCVKFKRAFVVDL
jgi:hypothetical protein